MQQQGVFQLFHAGEGVAHLQKVLALALIQVTCGHGEVLGHHQAGDHFFREQLAHVRLFQGRLAGVLKLLLSVLQLGLALLEGALGGGQLGRSAAEARRGQDLALLQFLVGLLGLFHAGLGLLGHHLGGHQLGVDVGQRGLQFRHPGRGVLRLVQQVEETVAGEVFHLVGNGHAGDGRIDDGAPGGSPGLVAGGLDDLHRLRRVAHRRAAQDEGHALGRLLQQSALAGQLLHALFLRFQRSLAGLQRGLLAGEGLGLRDGGVQLGAGVRQFGGGVTLLVFQRGLAALQLGAAVLHLFLSVVQLGLGVGQLFVHAGQHLGVDGFDLFLVEADLHALFHKAGAADAGHARLPFKGGDDRLRGKIGELINVHALHVHRGDHHRQHIRRNLQKHGVAGGVGQRAPHLIHRCGQVDHGTVHVGAAVELKHHGAHVFRRRAGDG